MYKMKKDGVVRIVATEAEAERWKSFGYEVVEEKKAAPGQQSVETDPLLSMEVDELKAFAAEKGIDIGNATSKNGIYKKIRDVLPWNSGNSGE